MSEKTRIQPLVNRSLSFQLKGLFYKKIADSGHGGAQGRQPFDGFGIWQGMPFYFEYKYCKMKARTRGVNIYDKFGNGNQYHQIKNLLLCQKNQGVALVLIELHYNRKPEYYAIAPEVCNDMYNTKKQIKLADFHEKAHRINMIHKEYTNEWLLDIKSTIKHFYPNLIFAKNGL